MTDETTPATPPTTPPTVKPGWKTTEFYLSLLATLLTALFASGVLTSSTALAIAGMAATVLTALGYKVTRTLIKTGAVLALFVLATSSQVGCTGLKEGAGRVAGNVVDCMTPAARTAIGELVPVFGAAIRNATAGDGKLDREALRATAAPLTTALTRCAFSAAIAEALRPRPLSKGAPQSSPLEVDAGDLRTTYELIRDAYFGGATFQLEAGPL